MSPEELFRRTVTGFIMLGGDTEALATEYGKTSDDVEDWADGQNLPDTETRAKILTWIKANR